MNSELVIGCVLPRSGGAIWWMFTGWRPVALVWSRLYLAAYLPVLNAAVVAVCDWMKSTLWLLLLIVTSLYVTS